MPRYRSNMCPSTDKWIKMMRFTHAMEYHPAIKKNEILQFATTWMYLEDIMLSDVTQRKTDILRSLIQRTNQWLPVGKQQGEGQEWGMGLRDTNYVYNKQQGSIIQHREIQLLFCNNLEYNL